ncbi:MAG: hypothetical protein MUP80_10610 [Acidobacteriia bacterium]|nr:hypothetical protein [Terriglobia bacterium]
MKRILTSVAVCLAVLCLASLGVAKEKKPKPGKLAGTWECISHGSSQGDMSFTLYLEHTKEIVSGSVSSPMGGTQITSASYKKKTLEIRIDTPMGNYLLTAKLKKNQLSGAWSVDSGEKGTWEGKKAAQQKP